jgi:mono/diheme cytochrome c family protein
MTKVKKASQMIPKIKMISPMSFSLRLFACGAVLSALSFLDSNCSVSTDSPKASSAKFSQYYNQGEQLYLKHCSNCHQKDGSGLGRVYPPLNRSDYMENKFEAVICLIRHGKSGEIFVNGKQFNQPMPGIPAITDLEVAQLATYIYNTWTHERGIIEVKDASKILKDCQSF